jgi:hypothetical protein
VLAQDHDLALAFGSSQRSAQIDLAAGTLGAFYPGASSEHVQANGGLRLVGSRTIVTGTARYFFDRAGASVNPLLVDSTPGPGGGPLPSAAGAAPPQSLTEYTVGGTVRFLGDERWTHTFVIGLDGYRLSNVANDFTPFPSSTDSALRAARGSADRSTLKASSVAHFGDLDGLSTALTFAAEHSALREQTVVAGFGGGTGGRPPGGSRGPQGSASATDATAVEWLTDAGLVAQADLALHQSYFLTLGARLERSDAFVGAARYSGLPMAGVAAVRDFGIVTVKLRAAYGKGIRAPRTATRGTLLGGVGGSASLAPEEQSGVEAGMDVFIGHALSLQVTRFDQLALGLIQQVVIPDSSSATAGQPPSRLALQYQNVGSIINRGWEMQSTVRSGSFSMGGSLAIVDSRVRTLATGYTGDLQPGDRVLEVPAATMSLSAGWSGPRWSGTVTASRAAHWVDYDRIALAKSYDRFDRRSVPLFGADLRGYWRDYDGETRLRTSVSYVINRGLSLLLTGENLLGQQLGEPDNVTILPGRTITTGLRASFW